MFWSGNYIVVRELKFLLKEENVTLTQVLEADDILQECKADNKALILFLTKPDILSELIGLITEEPPKNVELASQYRHANIASEVLTSNLSMLRDRLSMDATQMNRLCNFVNKDPPLNPLLASYFSKTVEMLLERSPKQDWYLHHIVCLQVLDFFKSRRDFLPNLLRHISTSAICDTFKCFLRLEDPFNKIIVEWFDDNQFLECLIQIICGTYNPDEVHSIPVHVTDTKGKPSEGNDKFDSNHNAPEEDTKQDPVEATKIIEEVEVNGETDGGDRGDPPPGEASLPAGAGEEARGQQFLPARLRAVAAANAAALLCEIALDACSMDPCNNGLSAGRSIAVRLRSEETVRRLLQGVFTSSPQARESALVHASRLLLALLHRPRASPSTAPAPPPPPPPPFSPHTAPLHALLDLIHNTQSSDEIQAEHSEVERAIAPHLPLLHHALLQHPDLDERLEYTQNQEGSPNEGCSNPSRNRVGAARVHVAALLARLALSEVDDVPTALITLGTAGVLIDMLFQFPQNNFLHAQVCALVRNARANRRFADRYTTHLIEECNLLTRLLDAFEENEDSKEKTVRAGYMGHVIATLRALDAPPLPPLPAALQARWDAFRETRLRPLLQRHDTALGGVYPLENTYEMDNLSDTLEHNFDFNEAATSLEEGVEVGEGGEPLAEPLRGLAGEDNMSVSENIFLELIASKRISDDMWDDGPDDDISQHVLSQGSPWEGAGTSADTVSGNPGGGEEGWAQFDAFAPPDPFASHGDPFWGSDVESRNQNDIEESMQKMHVSGFEDDEKDALTILLAQKMLTVFQNMSPNDASANDDQHQVTGNHVPVPDLQEQGCEHDEASSATAAPASTDQER